MFVSKWDCPQILRSMPKNWDFLQLVGICPQVVGIIFKRWRELVFWVAKPSEKKRRKLTNLGHAPLDMKNSKENHQKVASDPHRFLFQAKDVPLDMENYTNSYAKPYPAVRMIALEWAVADRWKAKSIRKQNENMWLP